MKLRTNRERRQRKLDKATAKAKKSNKQIRTTYKTNPCSSVIIASVKTKQSHFTITNASLKRKIKKVICLPKVLWSNKGTYIRKIHGEIGTGRRVGTMRQ